MVPIEKFFRFDAASSSKDSMHPPSLHRDSTKKQVARKRSAQLYKYRRVTAEGRRGHRQRRSPNNLACNELFVSEHFYNEGREKYAVFEHFFDEA